jgi:hypothetical protein
MKKLLTMCTLLLNITPVLAVENHDSINRMPARETQYSMRLNKGISRECRITIFMNKNQTHFIRKDFTSNSFVSFQEFYANQDENLRNESQKYNLSENIGDKYKKVSFTLEEDGNIYILFDGWDKTENKYLPSKMNLFEKANCEF